MDKLQYASGRAYVDVALPTEESKKKIRDSANHILTEVLVAFQVRAVANTNIMIILSFLGKSCSSDLLGE